MCFSFFFLAKYINILIVSLVCLTFRYNRAETTYVYFDKGKSIHETKAEGNRVSNMSLSRFLSDLCSIYGTTVFGKLAVH